MPTVSEPFTMQRLTSSSASEPSTSRRRAIYALERARVLFGGYRRGDANDPDLYVAAIAAVLEMYDVDLIRRVTDPRTGIATEAKFQSFMPNAGELKNYCDAELDRVLRMRRLEELPPVELHRPQLTFRGNEPGRRANVLVMRGAPQYEQLLERAATADPADWRADPQGIWVPMAWLSGPARPFLRRGEAC